MLQFFSKRIYKSLLVLATVFTLVCTSSQEGKAQDLSGRDFWFAVPTFSPLTSGASFGRFVYIVSDYCIDSLAYIEAPGLGWKQDFTVARGAYTEIVIPASIAGQAVSPNVPNSAQGKGFHVVTPFPVTVYLALVDAASSDGETIIPTNKLGNKYVLPIKSGLVQGSVRAMVIATENNTTVTVKTWNAAGNPIQDTVVLNRGETYMKTQTRSMCNADYEYGSYANCSTFDGTVIESDKPIATMGSIDCAGSGTCGACEVMMTMPLPESGWGSHFVTAQIMPRLNPNLGVSCGTGRTKSGDFFSILGEVGTNVTVTNREGTKNYVIAAPAYDNGANYGYGYLFLTVEAEGGLGPQDFGFCNNEISSDRPVQVVQYPRGWQADTQGSSDPEGIYVHPSSSWTDTYLFAILFKAGATTNNDVALIVEDIGTPLPSSQIELNGANVGAGGWTQIENTNYKYKLVPSVLSINTQRLISLTGAPVGVFSLSRAQANSFVTYGGAGNVLDVSQCPNCPIADFDTDKKSYCEGEEVDITDKSLDNDASGATQIVEWVWDYGDGTRDTLTSSTNPKHKYNTSGYYTITLYITNNNTAQPPCTQVWTQTILVAGGMTVDAGADIAGCIGDTVALGGSPTVTGGVGPFIYDWRPKNGLASPASSNTNALVYQSQDYIVEVKDSVGCVIEDTVYVTALPIDSVYLFTPPNPTICNGDSYNIEVKSSTGDGSPYNLVISDGTSTFTANNVADGGTFSVTPTANTSYSIVSVTSSNVQASCLKFSKAAIPIQVRATPTVSITGVTNPICLGSNATITFNLTGDDDWNIDYEFEGNTGSVNNINSTIATTTVTPTVSGPFNITHIEYKTAPKCPQTLTESIPMNVVAPSNPGSDSILVMCLEDGIQDLNPLLGTHDNTGQWNDIDGSGGLTTAGIFDPTGILPGVYNMEYFIAPSGSCPAASATIVLTLNGSPAGSNIADTLCDQLGENYHVELDVTGGDPSSYASPDGTFANEGGTYRFTSDPFKNKQNYSITITDGNNCDPLILTGYTNCACKTKSGTMDKTLLEACETDSIYTIHNNNANLLPNKDTLYFVLHEGAAGNGIGTRIDSNNTGGFRFIPGLMNYGQTYYVTAVAGVHDGSSIDYSDDCQVQSEGQPIKFHEKITFNYNIVASDVCKGEPFQALVNVTSGTAPFDIDYEALFDPATGTFPMVQAIDTLSFLPDSTEDYVLKSIENTFCKTTLNDTLSVTVRLDPVVSTPVITCNSLGTEYDLTFVVSDSDPATTQVDEIAVVGSGNFDLPTQTYTVTNQNVGTYYEFDVYDAYACDTIKISGIGVCACKTDPATIAPPANVCEDQTTTVTLTNTPFLDPNDSINYVIYANPGDSLTPLFTYIDNSIYLVNGTLLPNTTYYMSPLTGSDFDGDGYVDLNDPCRVFGNEVPVLFHELPNGNFTGDDVICAGAVANIPVSFTAGQSPFDINFLNDNVADSETGLGNTGMVSRTVNSTITFTMTNITDANGCSNVVSSVANITTTPAPSASLTIDPAICNGQSATVTINISGTAPYNFDVFNTTGQSMVQSFSNESNGVFNLTVSPTKTSQYTVINLSDALCTGKSDTTSMLVYDLPVASLSHSQGEICDGDAMTLDVGITGNAGPYNVDIEDQTGSVTSFTGVNDGDQLNLPYSDLTNTYTVTTITDGSTPTCSGSGNNVTVLINELPEIELAGNYKACEGETVDVAIQATKGTAPFSYNLYDGQGGVYGPHYLTDKSENTVGLLLPNSGIYNVYVDNITNAKGCNAVASSNTVPVEIVEVPTVSFNIDDAKGCPPISPRFTNTSGDQANIANCRWIIGNEIDRSSCAPFDYIFDESGSHNVSLIVTYNSGCIDTAFEANGVHAYDVPEADFTQTPDKPTIIESVVSFHSTSRNTDYATWYIDTLDVLNGLDVAYEFPKEDEGLYEIKMVASNSFGCLDSITKYIVVNGVIIFYMPNSFSPNGDGNNDVIMPVLNGDENFIEAFDFGIYNRWGQRVFHTTEMGIPWDGTINGQPVKSDVYTYLIKVKSKFDADRRLYDGFIHVLK